MKISNLLLITLFILAVVTTVISCKDDDDPVVLIGNWLELAEFEGDARYDAVAFSIGNVGFVGTGFNGDDRLSDFWAYYSDRNTWDIIASDTAFSARTAAVAFSAGGKGFVGTGRDDFSELKDFWMYDPTLNTWNRVADFPSARYGAVAFSINDIGYVGTGYDGNTLLDFYSYNPGTNLWSPIVNFPSKVRNAVSFVLDNMGYVCTGEKNGAVINDFYAYDPVEEVWNAKRKISDVSDDSYDNDYDDITRQNAVAFTIGGKAYLATGDLNGLKTTVFEYDPATDLWTGKTAFEGSGRTSAVAFSTADGRGFLTTGVSGNVAFDDLFEFKPADTYNSND